MGKMIELDGNFGEGGGQILRTALALSTITQKPFRIINIRKNRPRPGLKAQHLTAIKALQEMCDCKVDDAVLGSEEIIFYPSKIKKRNIEIDIGTAGSITLLLQSLLLPCIEFDKSTKIKIIGGTDVKWCMLWDYYEQVIVPQFKRYANIDIKMTKRGYFPIGNGEVEIKIKPFPKDKKSSIEIVERGNLIQIRGISHASKDLFEKKVAERQANAAKHLLSELDCPVNIDSRYSESSSTGSGISLWAIFSLMKEEINIEKPIRIGADMLGEKGIKAEEVGGKCAKILLKEINKGGLDNHLTDNLIPLLGLYGGEIRVNEISNHTKSNIYVVEKFLDVKFIIKDDIIKVEQA